MYWMILGVNDRRLATIKVVNLGHTKDKNGLARPTGPHTYRIEAVITDEDGRVDGTPYVVGPIPQKSRTISFTVTHKRELGYVSFSRTILKVLEGELKNAKDNAHAESFEIKS